MYKDRCCNLTFSKPVINCFMTRCNQMLQSHLCHSSGFISRLWIFHAAFSLALSHTEYTVSQQTSFWVLVISESLSLEPVKVLSMYFDSSCPRYPAEVFACNPSSGDAGFCTCYVPIIPTEAMALLWIFYLQIAQCISVHAHVLFHLFACWIIWKFYHFTY